MTNKVAKKSAKFWPIVSSWFISSLFDQTVTFKIRINIHFELTYAATVVFKRESGNFTRLMDIIQWESKHNIIHITQRLILQANKHRSNLVRISYRMNFNSLQSHSSVPVARDARILWIARVAPFEKACALVNGPMTGETPLLATSYETWSWRQVFGNPVLFWLNGRCMIHLFRILLMFVLCFLFLFLFFVLVLVILSRCRFQAISMKTNQSLTFVPTKPNNGALPLPSWMIVWFHLEPFCISIFLHFLLRFLVKVLEWFDCMISCNLWVSLLLLSFFTLLTFFLSFFHVVGCTLHQTG
jgi:hypothetical protein